MVRSEDSLQNLERPYLFKRGQVKHFFTKANLKLKPSLLTPRPNTYIQTSITNNANSLLSQTLRNKTAFSAYLIKPDDDSQNIIPP